MKKEVLVTVAIPTYNRPEYLRESLKSVLGQTYKNFYVLILDNHSDKDNESMVREFNDPRVKFIRHPKNIGIIANWNKAIELCNTKYLSIFHDDDIMEPEFLKESIMVLEKNNKAAFSYCKANKVDKNGKYLSLWSDLYPKVGLIKAPGYLIYSAGKNCCVTIAPTVVFRKDIFNKVGGFSDKLVFNSFDFNLYLRIALKYEIFFINKVLIKYRVHNKQMSQTYWWSEDKLKGRVATMLEIQQAIWNLINGNHKVAKNRDLLESLMKAGDKTTEQLAIYIKKILPDI